MPAWRFLCHILLLCGCLVPSPSVLEEWSFPEQLSWSWVVFSLVECNLCRNNLGSYFQVSTLPLTFPVLLSSTPSPLSQGRSPAPGSTAPGLLLCLVFCSYVRSWCLTFLEPQFSCSREVCGLLIPLMCLSLAGYLSQLFLTDFSSAGFLSHEHKLAKRRHVNSMMNSLFSH